MVKLDSPFGALEVALYIDKKTKLVTRMAYDSTAGRQTETDDFTDYKDVQGIKVAHKRTSTTQGRRHRRSSIDKVELDTKIDPEAVQEAREAVKPRRGWPVSFRCERAVLGVRSPRARVAQAQPMALEPGRPARASAPSRREVDRC